MEQVTANVFSPQCKCRVGQLHKERDGSYKWQVTSLDVFIYKVRLMHQSQTVRGGQLTSDQSMMDYQPGDNAGHWVMDLADAEYISIGTQVLRAAP